MANKDDHKMRCSFCGKPQDMVYKLITGPGVCICDECVELCNSILYDEEDLDPLEKTKRKKQEKITTLLLSSKHLVAPSPLWLIMNSARGRSAFCYRQGGTVYESCEGHQCI
jgi:hypothetical protein